MKRMLINRKVFTALALAGLLTSFPWSAAAQQPASQEPAAQQPSSPPMTGGHMMNHQMHGQTDQGAAGHSMCGPQMHAQMQKMMGRMMSQHQNAANLAAKLGQNLDAIEKQNDPAAMKAALAEQRVLVRQLRAAINSQRGTMQQMSGHMKSCPMMEMMNEMKHGDTESSPPM